MTSQTKVHCDFNRAYVSSAEDIDTASTAVTILGAALNFPSYNTLTPAAYHQPNLCSRDQGKTNCYADLDNRDHGTTNDCTRLRTRDLSKLNTSQENKRQGGTERNTGLDETRADSHVSLPENKNGTCDARGDEEEPRESTCEKYTSCRWVLAYMGSVMTLMMFCLRNCISMAIVCMSGLQGPTVSQSVIQNTSSANSSGGNSSSEAGNATGVVVLPGPDYIPASMQGVVLSAYYYGYILTPLVSGVIASRFGPKRMLSVSMATSSAFTLLMPVAIRSNIYFTVVLRILLGFVAGVTMPSSTMLWTQWAPTHEKGVLVTINFSGGSTGNIVANLVSGFLCSIPLDEGWPFIFYTYGAVAVLWTILWQFVAYDTPSKHPRITEKERAFFVSKPKTNPKVMLRPPIKAIFTSPAFFAMIFAHMAYSWFVGFVATYLPLYLNNILHYDIQASGALASLPFVARAILNIAFAIIADRLQAGGVLSVTNNRKLFQTIGLVLPGAMLLVLAFLDPSQREASVTMFIILSGLQSACQLGFRMIPLDIAPRFTAPVAGLSVTFGTAVQVVSPLVTSAIIADGKPESWSTVFIITGVIAGVGAAIFLVFGSAVEQEWAKEKKPVHAQDNVSYIPETTSTHKI